MFDVVVLGSGAAALCAAVTAADTEARVAVLEKAMVIGGTSAMSGGKIWIANNPHMAELGFDDSYEEALAYLQSLALGRLDPLMAETLLRTGPEMIRWLEDHTPLTFRALPYPDYRPEHPGGKQGGRTLDPDVFAFDELGEWAAKINLPALLGIVRITLGEHLASGGSPGLEYGAPDGPNAELFRQTASRTNDSRGSGQALIGGLLKACLDRGVSVQIGAHARRLIGSPSGGVTGVVFTTEDAEISR